MKNKINIKDCDLKNPFPIERIIGKQINDSVVQEFLEKFKSIDPLYVCNQPLEEDIKSEEDRFETHSFDGLGFHMEVFQDKVLYMALHKDEKEKLNLMNTLHTFKENKDAFMEDTEFNEFESISDDGKYRYIVYGSKKMFNESAFPNRLSFVLYEMGIRWE